MIPSTTQLKNTPLKIILPNTNKALKEVLANIPQEKLQTLSYGKNLNDILQNLLKESLQNTSQNKALLQLLQTNPTLKSLTNVQEHIQTLKQLLPQENPLQKTLHSLSQNIKEVNEKNLHSKLQEQQNDTLKTLLEQTHKDVSASTSPNKAEILKHIDKLLLQIDYFQLSSYLANAQTFFIPYSWDLLEDGYLSIKKNKEEQTFCDIELTLKHYQTLKLRVGLFEKNQLYITINAQSNELKTLLKNHIEILKKQLFKVNLIPKNISFVEEQQTPYYASYDKTIGCDFEVSV